MSVHFAEAGSSRPSVADLASFASRAKEIDLGSDDIVDLGDDLGMGLLTNPNKMAPSPRGGAPHRQMNLNFGSGPASAGGGGEMPHIQIKADDDFGIVDLDAAPGASDIRIQRDLGGPEPAPFMIGGGGGFQDAPASSNTSGLNFEEENRKKQDLLTKLQRLESSGIKGQRLTMNNSLEEIKLEYDKLTDSRNLEASIRFQRNALMTFVTGVEMVNDKVGHKLPVKPRLKGWSESVHTNIEDFDEIFEDLYDLYKTKEKMHPLVRLVGTLGVSATMYHLTNTMAERSGVPGMADMLNEDPALRAHFAQAMASKMGGLGQFMQAAGGAQMGGPPPMPMGMGMGPPAMGMGQPPSPPRQAAGRGPFNQASESAPVQARREMRGPVNVDDVLKQFEAERSMEQTRGVPISSGHAGVFSPSGPTPSSAVGMSILREGIGMSGSDPLADFMAAADDGGSIGSGSTMNTERRRGRRKVATPIVGSTLNLNV
jgi:hypothetical protein